MGSPWEQLFAKGYLFNRHVRLYYNGRIIGGFLRGCNDALVLDIVGGSVPITCARDVLVALSPTVFSKELYNNLYIDEVAYVK